VLRDHTSPDLVEQRNRTQLSRGELRFKERDDGAAVDGEQRLKPAVPSWDDDVVIRRERQQVRHQRAARERRVARRGERQVAARRAKSVEDPGHRTLVRDLV
jgi:hypothetical protein